MQEICIPNIFILLLNHERERKRDREMKIIRFEIECMLKI